MLKFSLCFFSSRDFAEISVLWPDHSKKTNLCSTSLGADLTLAGGANQLVMRDEMRAITKALADCGGLPTSSRTLLSVSCSLAERTALTRRFASLQKATAPWKAVPGLTNLVDAPGAFRAASGLGKAGVIMGAMQGASQVVAVGLTGYHTAKGLGSMWNEGKFNGHAFGQALKSGIDAVTGGVGTTDSVLGAARATANCVNQHGYSGCVRAAGRSVANAAGYAAHATKSCFREKGFGGCMSSAASVGRHSLSNAARSATVAAGRAAKGLYRATAAAAKSAASGSNWCAAHPGQCAHATGNELRRGFTNMHRAINHPLKECGYLGCVGKTLKRWHMQASEWRRAGVKNQQRERAQRKREEKPGVHSWRNWFQR